MTDKSNNRLHMLLREHPALIATAFYVAASAVGMFWSWAFLQFFGVNVFNYAQVSDFLLASLKEPFTWALVALAVLMVMADNANSRRVGRKVNLKWFRWYGSPRYRFVNNAGVILIVAVFIFAYAKREAENVREGDGKRVDVTFADGGRIDGTILLATTGQFVVLFDPVGKRVDIHPLEAIQAISILAE